MQRKRKIKISKDTQEAPAGSEAPVPGRNAGHGTTHAARAFVTVGALGRANPLISTNIRIGAGEISDQPTPAQFLAELANVIDLAEAGPATPAFVERVAGLSRWVQQDREWRHSGYDGTTLEKLESLLKELKACLEKAGGSPSELNEVLKRLRALHRVLVREVASRTKLPASAAPGPSNSSEETEVAVVDRTVALIDQLPPASATWNRGTSDARKQFEDAMKPLLERLAELGERHVPEARVPSPCGQSRFGNTICRPWVNLLGCHDACGTCREQARRALRLLREGIVDGRPSEKFIAPEVAAALINRATRAQEQMQSSLEQSQQRFRAEFQAMYRRSAAQKKSPHPPGMTDLQRAVLGVLAKAAPGHVVSGKEILTALDESGRRAGLSQGNLTSRVIPALEKKGVPIENEHPGYWIDWNRAPAWLAAMRSNGGAMTGQT